MLPKIRDNGKNVISTALCAKCGQELPYKHFNKQVCQWKEKDHTWL